MLYALQVLPVNSSAGHMQATNLACPDSLTTELKPVMMCPGSLAVHTVQRYMQERQSSSSKLPILHH